MGVPDKLSRSKSSVFSQDFFSFNFSKRTLIKQS